MSPRGGSRNPTAALTRPPDSFSPQRQAVAQAHARDLGDFSRLADAETFTREAWVEQQAHSLKHDEHGAATVVKALAHLPVDQATDRRTAYHARDTALNYLTKRLNQIQYAAFQAQGFPIGSGSVESANKLVVEARLKGSGMHWARPHVNALVALRTIACADWWAEAWPHIERHLRDHARQVRARHRELYESRLLFGPRPP